MHAVDVVETLPAARLDDAILPAMLMVLQRGLPGLAIADERGHVVACMSSVDLLRLVLPRYLHDQPHLARVFDEQHADRVAERLAQTPVRDVVGETAGRVPVVRPEATVVEIAEMMARQCCPLAMVEREGGGTLGIVTANRLLEVLVAAVGDQPR